MWFYKNTCNVLLTKLHALALVTLPTISPVAKHITSILLIFWCYLLAPIANFWKQTPLETYLPVPFEQSLFYRMNTLIADLCLLLLNLKMSVTISNWGFIWKYGRNAKNSENDVITNQTILKTPTRGEWSCGLGGCKWIGRFLVQTLIGASPVVRTQPC